MSTRLKTMASLLVLSIFLQFFSMPLASAEGNLLTNPGAETGDFTGWTRVNGGDGWALTSAPWYVHGGTYAFVASYAFGTLTQVVDLVGEGYSRSFLDREPQVDFSTFIMGLDSFSSPEDPYSVTVLLLNEEEEEIASFETGDQTATGEWQEISHSFTNYGNGLRYVSVELRGSDQEFWAGNYGAIFDDTSLSIVGNPHSGSIPFPVTIFVPEESSEESLKESPFEDVTETDHKTAIEYLYEADIVNGYEKENGGKEFKPDQSINRAEFLKMVMALTEEETEEQHNCFTDVQDQWFAPYVCTAHKKGIITGYGDGSFKPEQPITFEEMFTLALRAYGYTLKSDANEAWYKAYWDKVVSLNLLEELKPMLHKEANRGEAAQLLYNMEVP
ncbi:S-layer homology domain-containing protein [Candidatus Peregrinibacteria bacterium]|nr:MAG: S-layer homology domain-containing protein [Candidatus Peregrinibacteria bacterium]